MSNFHIGRPGVVKIGPVGSTEAECTDVGSTKRSKFIWDETVDQATSSKDQDAVVEEAIASRTYGLELDLEELTAENTARQMGAVIDTDGNIIEGGSDVDYVTAYVHGFKIEGVKKTLHIRKMRVKSTGDQELGGGAQVLLKPVCTVMVDTDSVDSYRIFKFLTDSADSTAPTITTVSPANATTAVAKAATTLVVWTFAEAIQKADVNAHNFFVHDEDDNVVAGTLALGTNDTVVTFTPSAAWTASKKFYPTVVAGVRDVTGNKLVADKITNFTTGS